MNSDDREKYLLNEDESGGLLLSERLVPSPLTWAVLVGFVVLWFLAFTPFAGVAGSAAGTVGAVLFLGGFTAAHCLLKHQVRERALLTGLTWPSARQYVIPWTSVDPGRIRLHHRANFLGNRTKAGVSWTYRFAPWNTVVVSVPGLAHQLAHPRRRGKVVDPPTIFDIYPAEIPTEIWYLGTRHPERFLRALENALVAAGRSEARGLAARQLANPVVEGFRHPPRDEDIYGSSPLRPPTD
jgi:hypothetical protein